MKKNYFYLLLALPMIVMLFTSSTGGRTDGVSGSPGDSGNTCTQCHAPGANFNASVAITSTVPTGGYALNTTYSVTVTITSSPNSTKSGFQITAEKSGGIKVGTFAGGTGSQAVSSNTRVTHTSTGSAQKTWTFSWTSPMTDQGQITFYASAVASNSANGNSGDQVVTATRLIGGVLNAEKFGLSTFKMYPNPSTDVLNISLPNEFNKATAMVVDVMGKTIINQTISLDKNTIDIQSLPAGTYILNLVSEDASASKTFVKK
jgi:hypothetical protein